MLRHHGMRYGHRIPSYRADEHQRPRVQPGHGLHRRAVPDGCSHVHSEPGVLHLNLVLHLAIRDDPGIRLL